MTAEMEEYQTLSKCQKVKKIAPKILPIILLSVILPTADVGTDLVLIIKLYKGVIDCVWSDGMWRDRREYWKCEDEEPDYYCSPERVSNNAVCGVSQYDCEYYWWNLDEESRYANKEEHRRCEYEDGPDQYCTPERVSNKNNTVCRLKKSSDSQYFCRRCEIWSSEWKDFRQCEAQGVKKYCSDPNRNHDVCGLAGSHPFTASSLLFFFLLNYMMGLVTCIRLEGRKLVPLITALFIFYPQYCKELTSHI